MCTRDSELVRMSRGAFQCISNKYPAAAVRLLEGMAQRMAGASNPAKGGKKLGPGFQVHGGGGGGGQKKRVATVALIPLEGQTKLCDAMASSRGIQALTSATVPRQLLSPRARPTSHAQRAV